MILKKRTGVGTKKRVYRKRPIVKYIVNTRPPRSIVWLDKTNEQNQEDMRMSTGNLRILMVLDQFNVGGTETHVMACTRELLRRGIHVVVVGKRGEMSGAFEALGCPIYELNFVTSDYLRNDTESGHIVSRLKQIMNIEGITVVHIHQNPSGHLATIATDMLHVPTVITLHMYNEQWLNDQELLRKGNAVICVSPSILKGPLLKGLPVQLIPNGVDMVQFDFRPFIQNDVRLELGIPDGAPVIMYAGRLSWEKADICNDLIRACLQLRSARFPDLHLVIAGEGMQSERIKIAIDDIHAQLGYEFIHIWGNPLNMSGLYSVSDCFVGTGRAALEALACRRPVIAIGVKGYMGLVKPSNYQQAWESWFGDHHADVAWSVERIQADLEKVLDMPAHERQEAGWVNRNYVKEWFNVTRTTNRLMGVYSNVLKERFASYEVK